MKIMMYSLAMATMSVCSLMACNDDEPILTQKDWDGTAAYFASTDEKGFETYYKPSVGFIGDPMPFYDPQNGDFKIMYLQEFRPNQATYHPIWAVSTRDAASYTALGELIPTGTVAEADAAIGTGSTYYDARNAVYYTYYTGHTAQEEVVMRAISRDFKTWTKDRTFCLKGTDFGYSKRDFRDPFVFQDEQNVYHMIVSTQLNGKGVLADFTSVNLQDWTHQGVFMTMMWDRFYECPDVFKMGNWWYLIYSEKHAAVRRVQYFKGRTLDELKACTANDAGMWPDNHEGFLDSRGFYAGKTASNGEERYIWGWCPTRAGNNNTAVGASPNEPEWAGNLVAHKIVQHPDGTLSLGMVPGIDRKINKVISAKIVAKSESGVTENADKVVLQGESYVLYNRLQVENKWSFDIKTTGNEDKFGISLVRGSDSEKYYTIVVNPESADKRKINFEEEGAAGKGFIAGIDGYVFDRPADNIYHVTICTDNSVCVVYINDNVAYTNRIYGVQKNCWSVNSYGQGKIEISNLKMMSK